MRVKKITALSTFLAWNAKLTLKFTILKANLSLPSTFLAMMYFTFYKGSGGKKSICKCEHKRVIIVLFIYLFTRKFISVEEEK